MPHLDNAKHEEFAVLLSKGVKQAEAYERAGYASNKGAASRLAQSERIVDRVNELRHEIVLKLERAVTTAPTDEDLKSLEEMGLTIEWVALKYKTIYEQALDSGSFGAANTAIAGIQKLIEQEANAKNAKPTDTENKIDMKDLFGVLDKFTAVVVAAKNNPNLQNLPGDDAVDITNIHDITSSLE
jgi:hypothetical protein